MEAPIQKEFSQEVNGCLSRIAETLALIDTLGKPNATLTLEDINLRLFIACRSLCMAIAGEDIDDVNLQLIRIAEDEGVDWHGILQMMILAQHHYLNGLQHVREKPKQAPSLRLMGEILENMKQHSKRNDMESTVTLKLAEIFTKPANLDMDNIYARLTAHARDTGFNDLIEPCISRALHIATHEYLDITKKAESALPGTATLFVNRVISE